MRVGERVVEIRRVQNTCYIDISPDSVSDREPLVLLHGLGNSLRFWVPILDSVSRTRRVVACDIPGFGHNPSRNRTFSISSAVDDLTDVVAKLQLGSYVLAGHSMGGAIALGIAGRSAEPPSSLILVDAHMISASRTLGRPVLGLIRRPGLFLAVLAQFLGGLFRLPDWALNMLAKSSVLRTLLLFPFVSNPAKLDGNLLREALKGSGSPNVLAAWKQASRYSVEGSLAGARCPIALIWGSDDRLLADADFDETKALVDVVDHSILDGVGHWPMLEAPEVFGDLLQCYDTQIGFGTKGVRRGATRHSC